MQTSMITKARMEVAGVVSFYMVAALVMVFVNKAVLISTPTIPLFFLLAQLVIAVILLHLSALFWPGKVQLPARLLDGQKLKKLTAVVAVNAIGLVFNTLCLRGVEAAFFQIARGLVLPLTIAVSSLHTKSFPTWAVWISASIVTVGFFLGIVPPSMSHPFSSTTSGENDIPESAIPSSLSLFYGFLSSLFIAIHAVLIKTSLPHVNNSTFELAYWSNAGSALMILPFVFFNGEATALTNLVQGASAGDERWNWGVFLSGTIITGIFGFLLCVAGLLSVKVTSPVTHMFSSAAKSVLQTILGAWLFNDILTINRAVSILIITLGTLYYTWLKATGQKPEQMQLKEATKPPRRQDRPEWDLEALAEDETEDLMVEMRKELGIESHDEPGTH